MCVQSFRSNDAYAPGRFKDTYNAYMGVDRDLKYQGIFFLGLRSV